MATVDTSLYQTFGVKPKSSSDYAEERMRLQEGKDRQESNKLALLIQRGQYGDQMAQRERGNRLATLGEGVSDPQELIQRLRQGGFHAEADAAMKRQADIGKENAQAEKERLAGAKQQIDLVLQAVSAAKDPQSYGQALQFLQANGIKTDGAPAQYDPAAIANFGQMALTAAQRIEQVWKQKGYDLDVRKADDMNARAAADRSVTMRGQNMTDSRARAQLAQQEDQFKRTQAVASDKPLNDVQSKALLFGSRMQEADKIIGTLIKGGTKTPSIIKQGVESVPGIGGALGMAANALVANKDEQMMEQAQRDFINATLRRESGAVISEPEFDNARKQYFPQPGDSADVIKQKAKNRALATKGILAEVPEAKRASLSTQNTGGATGDFGDGWVIKEVK